MLSLTRKTEYAIIGLAHLAVAGRRCSAREVSAVSGVPLPVLTAVLKSLSQHGLLRGCRGVYGGYELAKPATGIALLDIIAAVDGRPVKFVACADGGQCPMDKGSTCPVRIGLEDANRRMQEVLGGTSLADIITKGSR